MAATFKLTQYPCLRRQEGYVIVHARPDERAWRSKNPVVPIANVVRLARESESGDPVAQVPVSSFSRIKQRLDGLMLKAAKKQERAAVNDPDAVRIPPWRLHDLRRTCATGMAGIGIQPHVVEAVLNHVSGAKAGVAGVYNVHSYSAEKTAALERWTAHVEALIAGNVVELRTRA